MTRDSPHSTACDPDEPILHFLGLDGERAEPFYRPFTRKDLWRAADGLVLGEREVRYGVEPTNPADAGWGAIFAHGLDPGVRRGLEPLLDLRRRQAGERFRTFTLDDGETLDAFRRRIGAGIGPASPDRLPYYLLLVGDPRQIPFEFQYDLGAQHAVGRLAFSDHASYGLYARSVRAAEEPRGDAPRPRAGLHLFSFDRENDPPSEQARDDLARPLASEFSNRTGFDLRLTTGAEAGRDRFARSLLDGPSVVFTAGHSFLLRTGTEGQAEWQGSLITGSRRGHEIRARDVFRAADVPDDADLSGRVVYLYGCHTVGTPEHDTFDDGEAPRRLAPAPFVAPLAQRLLAPPRGRGALAVIGQVDRAIPSSAFAWNGVPQIDAFVDALRAVCDGVPVGRALESFRQRYAGVAVETLRALRRRSPVDPLAAWTAYHDARAVALLGDPLVATRSR